MIRDGQGPHQRSLLLIGSGRLARHLSFYFSSLGLDFLSWDRHQDFSLLREALPKVSVVALAISDDAIKSFYLEHLLDFPGTVVHFSGSRNEPPLVSAHPLMSFADELYEKDFYPQIHFAVTGVEQLTEIFPALPNPFTVLSGKDKAFYHAMCVLGGNFPVLLWNKMETELEAKGFPTFALRTYIARVAQNYILNGEKALTGPLIRKDEGTIQKNTESLKNDPWLPVYEAFAEVFR